MKILIVTHDKYHYKNRKRRMRWSWFPYYFDKLGHNIRYLTKKQWIYYPLVYLEFRPDVVIGVGKIGALITALHHKLKPKAKFIFDLNDHPVCYKNIDFLVKNHDLVTTPSFYYYQKYKKIGIIGILNGSNFKPLKEKKEYDIIYIGQTHSIYNIDKIKKECEEAKINLKIISELPTYEVPKYIAKAKLCLYPISWDASAKMMDYAAMGKAIVALKPNLAEKIKYPSCYTENLIHGIKTLINNKEKIKKLEKESLAWFKKYSGTWKEQAEKYLEEIK